MAVVIVLELDDFEQALAVESFKRIGASRALAELLGCSRNKVDRRTQHILVQIRRQIAMQNETTVVSSGQKAA